MYVQDSAFLATADAIGTRICRDALWAGERCNWIGASLAPIDGTWQTVQSSLAPDVYGGTAGIALFLARLAAASGDRVHRATALGAIRHARQHMSRVDSTVALSLYSGRLGIDYATIAVAETLDDGALIDAALRSLDDATSLERTSHQLDVVSGLASGIPALLSIDTRYHRPALLDLASKLGVHLVEKAIHSDAGLSWPNAALSTTHQLTGFSHGAAGIAWALLELHTATGDTAFVDAAMDGFRYERHWFDAGQCNWPDLRDFGAFAGGASPASGTTYGTSWCHGAPGIGLSRLQATRLLPNDETLKHELDVALDTTLGALRAGLATPTLSNFSLCHGLAGNAELPLIASTIARVPAYRSIVDDVGNAGIAMYERTMAAWPSGVTGGGDTPGLMLGSAGTGYFYLRLADPEGVPPIVITLADADLRAVKGTSSANASVSPGTRVAATNDSLSRGGSGPPHGVENSNRAEALDLHLKALHSPGSQRAPAPAP